MSEQRKFSAEAMRIYGIQEEAQEDRPKENKAISSSDKKSELKLDLNKENLIQGIILSEILGAPKARKRREKSGRYR